MPRKRKGEGLGGSPNTDRCVGDGMVDPMQTIKKGHGGNPYGRPTEGEKYTARVMILLRPSDLARVEAALDGRTRSTWIRRLIEKELGESPNA